MPRSKLHAKKKYKNIAVFLAVVGLMLVIYFVTVIRIKAGLPQ